MRCKEFSKVSSSYSPISSSSASPFSPLPNQRAQTMEEVWKDINLSSLQDHLTSKDDPRTTNLCGMTFQDFLATPSRTDHPISAGSPPNSSLVLPPATMLTLNSAQEIPLKHNPFLQNQTIHQISQHEIPFDDPLISGSGSGSIPFERKRFPVFDHNNTSDRRYKKMIKNRESAARSRARKQAYTNELELELAHLLEENAKLKKQQQHQKHLWLAETVEQPKKHNLLRASSAPF